MPRAILTALAVPAGTVLAALAAPLLVADPARSEREILERAASRYRQVKRFHLAGTVQAEIESKDGRQTSDLTFNLAAATGGRVRDELGPAATGVLRVSDGARTWVYLPSINQYAIQDQAAPSPTDLDSTPVALTGGVVGALLASYRTLADDRDSVRALPDETVEFEGANRRCRVIEVRTGPGGAGGPTASRVYWIDGERLVVLRQRTKAIMAAPDGDGTIEQTETFRFTRVSLDEPLPDTLFTFHPPAGAKQVDQFSMPGMEPEDLSGETAADFTLPDLTGKKHSLRAQRGKVVLLDFWATWCGPCRIQMPNVEKLHKEFRSKGLVVYAINEGEPADRARAYLQKNRYTTTTLLDQNTDVGKQYKVRGIPTLVIIDRQGKIVAHYVGVRPEVTLRQGLKRAGLQ